MKTLVHHARHTLPPKKKSVRPAADHERSNMLERKRKRAIKKYAADFMRMVKEDAHGALDGAKMPCIHCKHVIPVLFQETGEIFALPDNAKSKRTIIQAARKNPGLISFIAGGTYNDGADIEIFGYTAKKPVKLREAVRHEMLHSMLNQCGYPSGDDDELFIKMTLIYDA